MSANNTLVELDSDETNETLINPTNTNSLIDSEQSRFALPQPTLNVFTASVHDHINLIHNISAPLLSTIDDDQRHALDSLPLTANQIPSVAHVNNHQLLQPQQSHHHRRAFSDEQQRGTNVTQSLHTLQTHSNQYLNETQSATHTDYNLINLSQPNQSLNLSDEDDDDDVDEAEEEEEVAIVSKADIDTNSTNYLASADICSLSGDNHNLHSADDTVEISLLGDTSMDSRESQPLLGCGRDAQDYVYNNFPGKSAAFFSRSNKRAFREENNLRYVRLEGFRMWTVSKVNTHRIWLSIYVDYLISTVII